MILIDRLVHHRDLALAKSVVERGVHSLRRETEARRGIAVDDHVGRQSGILLVRTDVRNFRKRREPFQNFRPPYRQRVEVRRLQRVLVLRVALPAADAHVLRVLQEQRRARACRKSCGANARSPGPRSICELPPA